MFFLVKIEVFKRCIVCFPKGFCCEVTPDTILMLSSAFPQIIKIVHHTLQKTDSSLLRAKVYDWKQCLKKS